MSAGAPWSVKGIDPKAREIAKDLARRSGLTLGDWLNRAILEETANDAVASGAPQTSPIAPEEFGRLSEAIERLSVRVESSEHRSTLAISGIDQAVSGLLSRLEGAEREQVAVSARFEGALQEVKDGQVRGEARLAQVEETAAQPRSLEALRALEAALGKVANHLYDSETKTRETLTELRSDLGGLHERVETLSESDLGPSQAMVDGVVTRIIERLEEAEARTSGAIRGLETSVHDFDHRLRAAEERGEGPEQKLEQLAADLRRNFEDARFEFAEKVEEAVDGRFEGMERSLKAMADQMHTSEHRSTQAMERMGKEVLHVAEALGRRMEGVESRSAEAISQVGGDVQRIADVMEGRLRKGDQIQAESLERLGAEIARITERLADRIANAERRSAQAIDDVGEQVSRITERLTQRHERTSSELAERIRMSEERTAKLLDEAREKIDQRLTGTEQRLVERVTPPPAPPPPAAPIQPVSLFAEPDLPPGPFDNEVFGSGPFARRGGAGAGFVPLAETLPEEEQRSPFEGDDFNATQMFESFQSGAEEPEPHPEPHPEHVEQLAEAYDSSAPEEDVATPAPTTRELIAQARAAARAASQPEAKNKGSLFPGLLGRKKEKKPSKLRTAAKVSAGAAVLGLSALGLVLYSAQQVEHGPALVRGQGIQILPGQAAPVAQSMAGTPQMALAIAPAITAPPPASASTDAATIYSDAVNRIEAKDNTAVADLRRAANLGYAPAQFYLAKLYEGGTAGVGKDVAEARRWTERAAENGDRKAMHNLALYYFEGTGGPKNTTTAAEWFRRAAELGLVDSQYNLARLYEGGFGVSENDAEAYKWYLIASRSGDGESKNSADRLKRQLSPEAQKTAERAAQSFHAETTTTMRTADAR